MNQLKSYKNAKKKRHIVNGHPFKSAFEAMQYIHDNNFELQRIENILTISIYHTKAALKSAKQ